MDMPTRKKTTSRKTSTTKSQPVQARRVSRQQTPSEISYETKLTIVILLLLFVYPLGLIFMWVWMKNWPLWLKILISLPIVLGILGLFIGICAIAMIIRHVATDKNFQNQMHQYQYQQQKLTPMPSETITPSDATTPTSVDTNGAY